MSLLAEVDVAHPAIALTPTVESLADTTVEREQFAGREGGPTFLFFSASSDRFDRFEAAMATDPTVTDPLVVSEFEACRLYRVTLTDERKRLVTELASLGINLDRAYSSGGNWTLQVRLPNRDALSAFNDYCDAEGIDAEVTRLTWATAGNVGSGEYGLTDAQRDLLQVAHEEGYFDDPRGVSLQDLAEQFEVSPTALGRRLRRAQDNLVRSCLGS